MGEVSGLDIIFPRIFSALQGYDGGDEGIRTLERLPVTPLAGERLRPLGHVSAGVDMRQSTE